MTEIKISPHGSLYIVDEDYYYKKIVVPAGFVSDGATLHFLYYLWTATFLYAIFASSILAAYVGLAGYVFSWVCLKFPSSPRHMTASVVHDCLCRSGNYELGDRYFLEILLKTDKRCSAYLKYYAVRLYSICFRPVERLVVRLKVKGMDTMLKWS